MSQLNEQIAIVTGASGGIGGAIAAALAAHGATVYLSGRDRAKLEAGAARLLTASCRAVAWPMDLTVDLEVERLVDHVKERLGRLDILVHCAGTIDYGKLEEAPVASLDRQYNANVRGPLLLTQGLLPLLKKPRGQIVFINSSVGLTAKANAGHYSATKHALKALADALREEVNEDGVRVLSVFPGRTATPFNEPLRAKEGGPYRPELLLQPEDIANVVLSAVTLPWTAEVTNVSIRPMRKSN
jgi:short-subunit dehydrogenase